MKHLIGLMEVYLITRTGIQMNLITLVIVLYYTFQERGVMSIAQQLIILFVNTLYNFFDGGRI